MRTAAKSLLSGLGLALGLLMLTAATIPDAPIDGARSAVSAEFRQVNVPVAAPFRKFTGSVHYNPKKPDSAKAHIEIDMASLDVGSETYNAQVRKPEWFDSAQYPIAVFEASSIKAVGGGRFRATGELSLKGVTQTLIIPVMLTSAGGLDTFEGTVPISRASFNIGDAQWIDTVADEVLVKFRIVAPAIR